MNTIAQQFPNALLGHDSPLVSFKDVSKSYGDLTVVDGFNLDVHKGETVSIIGPSGSGKTTVLRLLMTLESVDQGIIYVNREPLTHMEKNGVLVPANAKHLRRMRSHIGMCFQHSTSYFKDRMTPVPEFGEVSGKNAGKYLRLLDRRLGESEFIAGEHFSIADITALCAIDFARVVKIRIGEDQANLQRWYDAVSSRPSAKA